MMIGDDYENVLSWSDGDDDDVAGLAVSNSAQC